MSDNRITKYLEEAQAERGPKWFPETDEEKNALAERCTNLMLEAFDLANLKAAHPKSVDKLKVIMYILVEYSIFSSAKKNTNFFQALGISMGTLATLAVNQLIVIGKIRQ